MSGHHYGRPLNVTIERGALVIRVGAQVLAHAVTYSEWANPYDYDAGDYFRDFAILDAPEFAKDVARAMLSEREDGSSPLSDFLDAMSKAAIEDGSMAADEARIKHGETDPRETWALESASSQNAGATPSDQGAPVDAHDSSSSVTEETRQVLRPVRTLGCGCFYDSLGRLASPCAQHEETRQSSASEAPSTETRRVAWLMERRLARADRGSPRGALVYWDGGHAESFTGDPWKAVQWPSKEAAQRQCPPEHYAQWGWRYVEHLFTVEAALPTDGEGTATEEVINADRLDLQQ